MKFSYSKMETCTTELQAIVNNIEQILNHVSEVCNLLSKSEYWKGEGSQFLLEKMGQFTSNFDDVIFELENTVQYLRYTMEGYQLLDKKVTTGIQNLLKGVS